MGCMSQVPWAIFVYGTWQIREGTASTVADGVGSRNQRSKSYKGNGFGVALREGPANLWHIYQKDWLLLLCWIIPKQQFNQSCNTDLTWTLAASALSPRGASL